MSKTIFETRPDEDPRATRVARGTTFVLLHPGHPKSGAELDRDHVQLVPLDHVTSMALDIDYRDNSYLVDVYHGEQSSGRLIRVRTEPASDERGAKRVLEPVRGADPFELFDHLAALGIDVMND